MSGDEERLLSLFRSLDTRGKEHLLVIAEAEAKHAAEGLQKARRAVLNTATHNFTIAEQNDEIGRRYD